MYEAESACFDPNTLPEGTANDVQISPNTTLLIPIEEQQLVYQENPNSHGHDQTSHQLNVSAISALDAELQQQLEFNTGDVNCNATHLMQDPNQILSFENQPQPTWENHVQHDMNQELGFTQQYPHDQTEQQQLPDAPYPPTSDLLNLFHLPRCSSSSLIPNAFVNPNQKSPLGLFGDLPVGGDSSFGPTILYDPLCHLNLPPQPPLFRDLFQSLPHGYNLHGSTKTGSIFGGSDHERERRDFVYQDGDERQFDNGVLEFSREMDCVGKGGDGKFTKHFATERQRRQQLNGKYKALRDLVPNPTKSDRASVVGDAINYIKELLRTVNELKLLVEKKRCSRERIKRLKTEDEGDIESSNMKPVGDPDQSYNNSLRSSWLQRKSKDTEVDVRIIHDEVTIKLIQRKKINCLLIVSRILDQLQLDLCHVAGGHIGDYYSFLFNTKICEGSSVYASAIANKLIEVVDGQYAAAFLPTSSL
ncbi:Myc-type, basic helix-loop-helix (bHLH) domain [Dillenia turbinata]|uniref:Myc-type, basic helix-loop-helix (BHLH) domain n=1 Tax=Dillenia turbinata TaxID=194707 RepID=A0AAN8YYX5_9MAGN